MKYDPSQMTRRDFLSAAVKTGVILAVGPRHLLAKSLASSSPLPFDPISSAKPWVYWIWLNGNITAEGLTADLEAMQSIGIGGAIMLHLGSAKAGPVKFNSPEFQKLVSHLLSEADRLGLQIDFNNDDGWDAAGPWVQPEHGMQKLVWTESHVAGGTHVSTTLAQPKTIRDYYRDIAVFAIPAPLGSSETLPEPKLTELPGSPSIVLHDYGRPIVIRSADINVGVTPDAQSLPISTPPVIFTLECSDDGVSFRTVYHFDNRWRFAPLRNNRFLSVTVRFAPVQARYFRLVLPFIKVLKGVERNGKSSPALENRFRLSAEDQIAFWQYKGGHSNGMAPALEKPDRYPNGWHDALEEANGIAPPPADARSVFGRSSIIDLTAHSNDGHLDWTASPGDWIVIRLGHTPTGATNFIASAAGRGLEIDYLSKAGLDNHFPNYLGLIASQNAGLIGKSLTAFHMDSWEGGPLNWTSDFAEQFQARRGYSMHPYLAVLAGGRIVGGLDESERFLWDFRLTIADLIAENFWEYLTELCHAQGILCSNEGAGYQQFMGDPLRYLSKCDMPMGEFWVDETDLRPDCHLASSVANTYSKRVVGGEAYTSTVTSRDQQAGQWMDHPYSLKAYGDRAFCIGVNRFVFHRSVHQPQFHESPGLAWPNIGINMERTNTWWKPGAAWIAYLTRCQHLLQSGIMVADICVLVREGVPNVLIRPEGLAAGYRYDGFHTELLATATVERGEIVLPNGMRYRILVLPPDTTMTPHVAREVGRLLQAGVTIVGAKPTASPSLADYPACDQTLAGITAAWKHLFATIDEAIRHVALEPDFVCKGAARPEDVLYLHRRDGDTEIYFVSNQTSGTLHLDASFRIANRAPSVLDPDSGEIVPAGAFRSDGNRTTVPLVLAPSGSVFVLFREAATREAIMDAPSGTVSIFLADGTLQITTSATGKMKLRSTRGRTASLNLSPLPSQSIHGPWTIAFPPNWGAPAHIELDKLVSWSDHADEGVRHFSGSATYTVNFSVEVADMQPGRAIFLDLGDVEVIAEVTLNGWPLGTRWKPPFRYDVTEKLHAGTNTLAVTVTNLWPNRLIGDASLPEEKRFAKTNYRPYTADSPLLPSGLIGPVVLAFAHRQAVRWD